VSNSRRTNGPVSSTSCASWRTIARESRVGTPVFRDAEIYEEFAAARQPGGGTTAVRSVDAGGGDLPEKDARQDLAESMPFGDIGDVPVGPGSGWQCSPSPVS
jgi:cation:H+ antiporter